MGDLEGVSSFIEEARKKQTKDWLVKLFQIGRIDHITLKKVANLIDSKDEPFEIDTAIIPKLPYGMSVDVSIDSMPNVVFIVEDSTENHIKLITYDTENIHVRTIEMTF